jgi:hypothetical protein
MVALKHVGTAISLLGGVVVLGLGLLLSISFGALGVGIGGSIIPLIIALFGFFIIASSFMFYKHYENRVLGIVAILFAIAGIFVGGLFGILSLIGSVMAFVYRAKN